MDVLHVVFSIGRLCESPSCYELSSYCHVCKCVCVWFPLLHRMTHAWQSCLWHSPFPWTSTRASGSCRAWAWGSGACTLSCMRGCSTVSFCSALEAVPKIQQVRNPQKEPLEADITGFPELRLNLQLPSPFGVNGPVTDSVYLDSPALPTVGTARKDTLALRGRERQLGQSCVTFSSFEVGSKGRAEILGFLGQW